MIIVHRVSSPGPRPSSHHSQHCTMQNTEYYCIYIILSTIHKIFHFTDNECDTFHYPHFQFYTFPHLLVLEFYILFILFKVTLYFSPAVCVANSSPPLTNSRGTCPTMLMALTSESSSALIVAKHSSSSII